MTWNITDRFPNWGETGESPSDGFFYDGGDQVNEKHLDYLWNSIKGLEDDVQASLNDIDSDSDGRVDAADTSQKVKGNDIDSDGDGTVDNADNATNVTSTYKGNDIDSDGDGKVDSADNATNVTSTYKGNDIDSDGDGTVDNADNGVPSGGIVMWSGSTTNVPSGWTLCDGTDGAPDLRNRFIAGAGDEYNVGDTGGEKEHQLTQDEMPSHTHGGGFNQGTGLGYEKFENSTKTEEVQTGSAGGDQAHENRPRFYALAYIYKL